MSVVSASAAKSVPTCQALAVNTPPQPASAAAIVGSRSLVRSARSCMVAVPSPMSEERSPAESVVTHSTPTSGTKREAFSPSEDAKPSAAPVSRTVSASSTAPRSERSSDARSASKKLCTRSRTPPSVRPSPSASAAASSGSASRSSPGSCTAQTGTVRSASVSRRNAVLLTASPPPAPPRRATAERLRSAHRPRRRSRARRQARPARRRGRRHRPRAPSAQWRAPSKAA